MRILEIIHTFVNFNLFNGVDAVSLEQSSQRFPSFFLNKGSPFESLINNFAASIVKNSFSSSNNPLASLLQQNNSSESKNNTDSKYLRNQQINILLSDIEDFIEDLIKMIQNAKVEEVFKIAEYFQEAFPRLLKIADEINKLDLKKDDVLEAIVTRILDFLEQTFKVSSCTPDMQIVCSFILEFIQQIRAEFHIA